MAIDVEHIKRGVTLATQQSRACQAFQSRRDVNSFQEIVTFLNDHVAKVQADAQTAALVVPPLNGKRALQGGNRTCKLGEEAVACRLVSRP